MRVLFCLSSMPMGGLEIFTINLAEKLAKAGAQTGILMFKSSAETLKLIDGRINIFVSGRSSKINPFFFGNVRRDIKKFNPDIILSASPFTYFFVELARSLSKKSAPHIIAFHTLAPLSFKEVVFNKLALWFSRLRKAYYLFICAAQRNLSRNYYNLPGERTFVIHNGVDADFFASGNRTQFDKTFNIVHVANTRPEKDQWTLIKSMEVLNKSLTKWELIFVGQDRAGMFDEFKKYLCDKGLQDKVNFIEAHGSEAVKKILSTGRVFVLTSVMEVLPVSALEAMAMGMPCILTDVGGCSEIVEDGYNGYLIKPKDFNALAEKLLYLSQSENVLQNMSQNARKTVIEKFSLTVCAEKYSNLFGMLVNNTK